MRIQLLSSLPIVFTVWLITSPADFALAGIAWSPAILISYIRFIAATFLVFFVPGYSLMGLLHLRRGRIEDIIWAFTLSAFLQPVTVYLLARGLSISIREASLISSVLFSLLFFLTFSASHANPPRLRLTRENEFLFAIAVLVLLSGALIAPNLTNIWDLDFWRFFGMAISSLINGPHPAIVNGIVYSNLSWWASLWFSDYLSISGGPLIPAALSLVILEVMPTFAFYCLTLTFQNLHLKGRALATLSFAFLAGPAWIFTASQGIDIQTMPYTVGLVFSKTYDSSYTDALPVFGPYLPAAVGLTILLALMSILFREDMHPRHRIIISGLLISAAYMIHAPEAVFFLVVALPLGLFVVDGGVEACAEIGLGALLGLLAVLLIDKSAVGQIWVNSIFYWILLAGVVVLVIARRPLRKCFNWIFQQTSIISDKWQRLLLWVVSSIFILAIDLGVYFYPSFKVQDTLPLGYLPWYFFGLRFWIPLAILFGGLWFIVLSKKRLSLEAKYCIALLLLVLLFGRFLTFTNALFSFSYWENIASIRYAMIPIALLVGILLQHLSHSISSHRDIPYLQQTVTTVVVLALVAGSGTTLLNQTYWATLRTDSLQSNVLSGLEAIRRIAKPTDVVLTAASDDSRRLVAFGGISSGIVPDEEANLLFSSSDPIIAINILNHPLGSTGTGRVTLLYLTRQSNQYVTTKVDSFFAKWILPYLPILYADNTTKILRVPQMVPPGNSNLALALMNDTTDYDLISAVSLAGFNYSVFAATDPAVFSHSTILVVDSQNVDPNTAALYLSWATSGHDLVVVSENLGPFAKDLQIESNGSLIVSSITDLNGTLPATRVDSVYCNQSKTLLEYIGLNGAHVPFALLVDSGKGKVLYIVDMQFPRLAISPSTSNDERISVFSILQLLLEEHGGMSIQPASTTADGLLFSYGIFNITGNISILSDSVRFNHGNTPSVLVGAQSHVKVHGTVTLTKSDLPYYSNFTIIGGQITNIWNGEITITQSTSSSVSLSIIVHDPLIEITEGVLTLTSASSPDRIFVQSSYYLDHNHLVFNGPLVFRLYGAWVDSPALVYAYNIKGNMHVSLPAPTWREFDGLSNALQNIPAIVLIITFAAVAITPIDYWSSFLTSQDAGKKKIYK